MIKRRLLTCFLLLCVIACNEPPKHQQQKNYSENSVDRNSNRKQFVKALFRLKEVIISGNKERIADLLNFPVAPGPFLMYTEDSVYNQQLLANNNLVTKTIFLQHYAKIADAILMNEAKHLFQQLPLDTLLYTDRIEASAYKKSEPCYYTYAIEINGEEITLHMDMRSNEHYDEHAVTEDGIPANSSEYCEHNFWWVFRWDGKKLELVNISGAD